MRLFISTIAVTITLGLLFAPTAFAITTPQVVCMRHAMSKHLKLMDLCSKTQYPKTDAGLEAERLCIVGAVSSYYNIMLGDCV
ncbi:hypothetical protein IMCC20628_02109 [Hoeflea sp. IMCC20628]|uniref:hypothetical protein n=1 Tax=Hoeflea sp. IMCC20628 TaxID=1620421 RepID=UPI00063BF11C|nr:hypothetical protein [Hoeflea sp. IMCC20628]AKI00813.1 hypothetical protein IMCC20628_02109 [Hoeflea sp. IMCC20628]